MDPELINKVTWKIPNALALIGSASGEEWNGMTASWVTQVSMEPVLIGVGVDNKAVTHRSDQRWGVVHREPVALRRHPGVRQVLQAGYEGGRHAQWPPGSPGVTGAPIFDESLAWMECSVRHSIDLGTHTFFVGELVDAGVNDDERQAASMSDTRMKYGGVRRGGH